MGADKSKVQIASLWVGEKLSWLEQLCLTSFVDAGHDVTLFTYGNVVGVPKKVTVTPAQDILSDTKIIRHKRTGSPAFHADLFRLHLLKYTDMCWVDTDAYCVKPFEIPDHGHFHGLIPQGGRRIVNNGVLKLPKESQTLTSLLEFTQDEYPVPPWYRAAEQEELLARKKSGDPLHVSEQKWGVWGPQALTYFLNMTGEIEHAQPPEVLYPIPFQNMRHLLRPGRLRSVEGQITPETQSVHFWGRRFRSVASGMAGIPPKGSYAANALERHAVDPRPTAYLMRSSSPESPGPRQGASGIDFSMFSDRDVANVLLQRPASAYDRGALTAWENGDDAPLLEVAMARRDEILTNAFEEVQDTFREVHPFIASCEPKRIADIGAGNAFVDLLIYRRLHCDLYLIDIESNERRGTGFDDHGVGTANLATARAFLTANLVPDMQIKTINPLNSPEGLANLPEMNVIISLLACGFHFPLRTYDSLFRSKLAKDGGLLLDVRPRSGWRPYLSEFGTPAAILRKKKVVTTFTKA